MEDDHPGVALPSARKSIPGPLSCRCSDCSLPIRALPYTTGSRNREDCSGREHWLDFKPFRLTFRPNHLSASESEAEVNESWRLGYGPRSFARTQRWLVDNRKPFDHQVAFLVARLLFRGIYFPQSTPWSWVRLLASNARTIARLVLRRLFYRPAPPEQAIDLGTVSAENPALGLVHRDRLSEEL